MVARAVERADGAETTDVVLVELASGATRELISRQQAELNETYETFVTGLRWLDDRRVEVSLSDGDVGGTDLMVDASTGTILRRENNEDANLLVSSEFEFTDVAAGARSYRQHFTREELERSLGSAAVGLSEKRRRGAAKRSPYGETASLLYRVTETANHAHRQCAAVYGASRCGGGGQKKFSFLQPATT